jgi:hypothetical protein
MLKRSVMYGSNTWPTTEKGKIMLNFEEGVCRKRTNQELTELRKPLNVGVAAAYDSNEYHTDR